MRFSPAFHVARNNGNGTFASPVSTNVTTYEDAQMTVADTDADGDVDIVVTDTMGFDALSVYVFANDGAGTFGAPTEVASGFAPQDVGVGDVDRDGVVDLVTVHNSGNGPEIRLLRGLGGGSFAAPVGISTGAREWKLVLADVSGDSWLDLVVLSRDDTFGVLVNDQRGGFAPVVTYEGEEVHGYLNGSAVAVGDLDADGRADVVIANRTGNDVSVNWGLGNGRFDTQQVRYGMNQGPRDVTLGDLNGDGRLDLVGPNSLAGARRRRRQGLPDHGRRFSDGDQGRPGDDDRGLHRAEGDGRRIRANGDRRGHWTRRRGVRSAEPRGRRCASVPTSHHDPADHNSADHDSTHHDSALPRPRRPRRRAPSGAPQVPTCSPAQAATT